MKEKEQKTRIKGKNKLIKQNKKIGIKLFQ